MVSGEFDFNLIQDTAITDCVGTGVGLYETEEECLNNYRDYTTSDHYPGYYPQGGTNNCQAYED